MFPKLTPELQSIIFSFDPTFRIMFERVLQEAIPIFKSRIALLGYIRKISYWNDQLHHLDFRGSDKWRMWLIDKKTNYHFFEEFQIISIFIYRQHQKDFLYNHLHDLIPENIISLYSHLSHKAIKILHQHLPKEEYQEEIKKNVEINGLLENYQFVLIFSSFFYSQEWVKVYDSHCDVSSPSVKEYFKIGLLSKQS